jgi:hypothetical protein
MTDSHKLNEKASVDWFAIPEFTQIGETYGEETLAFDDLRSAVLFVVEQLPRQQQPTAKIRTFGGRTYNFSELSLIYRSSEFD